MFSIDGRHATTSEVIQLLIGRWDYFYNGSPIFPKGELLYEGKSVQLVYTLDSVRLQQGASRTILLVAKLSERGIWQDEHEVLTQDWEYGGAS